ncbi:MAG: hypothetical protein OQK11_08720 [Thiovulaceae bacterium]|nr:hypothetical protein [Sulfurimonadaceae bacterium]
MLKNIMMSLALVLMLTACGSDSSSSPEVASIESPENTQDTTITYNGITYGSVISSATGRTWLDRNLGAEKVCNPEVTESACWGDLYQWGREADGHQETNSTFVDSLAADIVNVGNAFLGGNTEDWTTADENGSERKINWNKTDGSVICPVGYRVPTVAEFENEIDGLDLNNSNDILNSFLKLPITQYRKPEDGSKSYVSIGVYHTQDIYVDTTVNVTYDNHIITFNSTSIDTNGTADFHFGLPVRCIKD